MAVIIVSWLFVVLIYVVNTQYEIFAFNFLNKASPPDIKVLSWNVHCSNVSDIDRQEYISELIIREDPDIVLLNEFKQDICYTIDLLLRQSFPYVIDVQTNLSCGDVLYCKIPIIDGGNYVLSKRKKEDKLHVIKGAIVVNGKPLHLFGCHLVSSSGNGCIRLHKIQNILKINRYYVRYKRKKLFRHEEANLIKGVIEKKTAPIILMGDMNDFSVSSPIKTFERTGLINAWWEGGCGYGCTFHQGWMRLRIDHIFHSPELKLCKVKVIPTNLSDHNPLVAEFKVV